MSVWLLIVWIGSGHTPNIPVVVPTYSKGECEEAARVIRAEVDAYQSWGTPNYRRHVCMQMEGR